MVVEKTNNLPPVDEEVQSLQLLMQLSPDDIKAINDIELIENLISAANKFLAETANLTLPKGRFGGPSQLVPESIRDEMVRIRGLREKMITRFRELEEKATKVA